MEYSCKKKENAHFVAQFSFLLGSKAFNDKIGMQDTEWKKS